jgi:2-oxoglutarate ferredoxin oxidoreductase subunit alpha
MTPINALITYLADHEKKLNIVYTQPEDEISGMNMALGASVAGVRSMVATSGGGFDLMVEGLSLCGMIETPLVIDLGMRVGPATGMPTWTEQGELDYVISAGHGEFPRIVLAPGDAEDVFRLTVDAFNLADEFQIPVFLLTDKYLNESQWCVPAVSFTVPVRIDRGKLITSDLPAEPEFKRYSTEPGDGISPRSIPGVKNGNFIANSYEHDESGIVTEAAVGRVKMASKRLKKAIAVGNAAQPPVVIGPSKADISFVSWGTTKGPVIEAMSLLSKMGIKSNLIHFSWLYPFPVQAADILKNASRLILVEQNTTGQLGGLIRKYTGIEIKEKFLKFDGRPFFPEEIAERIKS